MNTAKGHLPELRYRLEDTSMSDLEVVESAKRVIEGMIAAQQRADEILERALPHALPSVWPRSHPTESKLDDRASIALVLCLASAAAALQSIQTLMKHLKNLDELSGDKRINDCALDAQIAGEAAYQAATVLLQDSAKRGTHHS